MSLFAAIRIYSRKPFARSTLLLAATLLLSSPLSLRADQGSSGCTAVPGPKTFERNSPLREAFDFGSYKGLPSGEIIDRASSNFDKSALPYSNEEEKERIEKVGENIKEKDKKRIDAKVFECLASSDAAKSCGDAANALFGGRDKDSLPIADSIYFFDKACRVSGDKRFCEVASKLSENLSNKKSLERSCDKGDGEACYRLAKMYGQVPGSTQPPIFPSLPLFLEALKKGCEAGSLDSCIVGSLMFQRQGRYPEMAKMTSSACELGDSESCYIGAGLMEILSYEERGVNEKMAGEMEKLSERMYEKACSEGYKPACTLIEKRKTFDEKMKRMEEQIIKGKSAPVLSLDENHSDSISPKKKESNSIETNKTQKEEKR